MLVTTTGVGSGAGDRTMAAGAAASSAATTAGRMSCRWAHWVCSYSGSHPALCCAVCCALHARDDLADRLHRRLWSVPPLRVLLCHFQQARQLRAVCLAPACHFYGAGAVIILRYNSGQQPARQGSVKDVSRFWCDHLCNVSQEEGKRQGPGSTAA